MKIYIIFSIIYSIGISQIYNDFNGQNKAANATNQSKLISNQEKSEWDITIPRGKTRQINFTTCLLYTSPSARDATLARMPDSA